MIKGAWIWPGILDSQNDSRKPSGEHFGTGTRETAKIAPGSLLESILAQGAGGEPKWLQEAFWGAFWHRDQEDSQKGSRKPPGEHFGSGGRGRAKIAPGSLLKSIFAQGAGGQPKPCKTSVLLNKTDGF